MSNRPAISAGLRSYPADASHSRAPSRCTAAPRSRAQATCVDQVVPGRQLATDLALRQLQQQRGQRFGHPLQVGQGEQPVALTDRTADQLMQPGVGLLLVAAQVAGRVPGHGAAGATVGVHPQRGALGHRPAGQEHRGGLAQQLGDLALQVGHHAAVAVHVGLDVRAIVASRSAGRDVAVAVQESCAAGAESSGVVVHPPIVRGGGGCAGA